MRPFRRTFVARIAYFFTTKPSNWLINEGFVTINKDPPLN